MPESGLISRFFRYLARFFANPPAPITAGPAASVVSNSSAASASARPLTQPTQTSTSKAASVSTSAAAAAAPTSSSQVGRKAEMHTTITRFAQELAKMNKHTPMIKFLGPRKQQPKFDRSSLPSLAMSSSDSGSSKSSVPATSGSQQKASSIGPVGSTPRGTGIDEALLPNFLKRRLPDADEIDAINIGSAYGR